MPCIKCGKEKYYESSKKSKEKLQKKINGKIFNLLYCEKCLEELCPSYKDKNKSRIFNSLNDITKIAFGVNDEDFNKGKQSLYTRSKENFIKKYGEEEGIKRWETFRSKLAFSNTLEFHTKKYGEEEGIRKYEEYSKLRSSTKENFIRRYGENDGFKKWNSYIKKQSYSESLEYCIEKFGDDGYSVYKDRCKNKALTLDRFIKKYGEKDGAIKWHNYRKKYIESFSRRSPYSKKAQSFFDKLKQSINDLDISYYDSSNKERYFVNESGKFASVDFYIPEIDTVIEYYGDFWHANPKIYDSEDKIHTTYLAKDIWEKDKIRLKIIKAKHVIIVWELDANDDKIKELKNFIENELRNRN